MVDDFLSQDEVDALLKNTTDERNEDKQAKNPSVIRPYDLTAQARMVRGHMPTLERINKRFARLLRIGISNFMHQTINVVAGPVKVDKFCEFGRNLTVPTNLNMVRIKPLQGTALMVFEPNLFDLIVDSFFGGDGCYPTGIEDRDFPATGIGIIKQILNIVFEEYEKAWKPVYPIQFEYIRSELNPQVARIATPNETVVCFSLDFGLGNKGGALHICIPYAMVEPIRGVLYSEPKGDPRAIDKRRGRLLSKQIQDAEVELVANFGQATVTFEQVLSMQTGDVIPIGIPESVTAGIDNVPVMECRYGIINGQYALRVNSMLSQSKNE